MDTERHSSTVYYVVKICFPLRAAAISQKAGVHCMLCLAVSMSMFFRIVNENLMGTEVC